MSAAIYATDGGRCGVCGHTWAELPPPGDEFHRQVIGQRVTDGCAKCRTPARRPCAGWVREDGRWSLQCGSLTAYAYDPRPGREVQGWAVEVHRLGSANHGAQLDGGYVATHDEADPARIAAEDALLAVADEIRRAVGR